MAAKVVDCLPRPLLRCWGHLRHYSSPSSASPCWQCMVPIVNLEEKSKLAAAASASPSAIGNGESAKLLLEEKRQAFLCE